MVAAGLPSGARSQQFGQTTYRAPQLAGSRPALRGRGTTVQC